VAKKKQDTPPAGSPAWMATFSDLMNLLLCFFVLLFSMSSVDQEKFTKIVASLQSSFSILPQGGASIGEGQMISAGISQLEQLDIYYKEANSQSEEEPQEGEEDLNEKFEEAALAESEQMAEQIEGMLQQLGIGDKVQLDVTAQYTRLTLNGALLFDSGKGEFREDAIPLVQKLGTIVEQYAENTIVIEGHTDNVPMASATYENNDVLSFYRALAVKDYFTENTLVSASNIRAEGCGEYRPVADNGTPEGRALNRRVEIKIHNSFSNE